MPEYLQIRIHGKQGLPTLIYLPGLHGDWTLIGRFRDKIAGHARFVEFTYPRTLTWTLEEYAAAVETALLKNQIRSGWLLGESFGSQIIWPLVMRGNFSADGIILAGGFVRHPLRGMVRRGERLLNWMPFGLLIRLGYAFTRVARIFYARQSPERRAEIAEFAARRTRLDVQAAVHRLHLVAENDPRSIACATAIPIFYLSGLFDPIVFWPLARHWIKRNCPALHGVKIIPTADHTVLTTGSTPAARQILEWMR
jgi:pimeloyl-ACP methyl ester carboxylesterase